MNTVRKKRGKEEAGGGISSITPAPLLIAFLLVAWFPTRKEEGVHGVISNSISMLQINISI